MTLLSVHYHHTRERHTVDPLDTAIPVTRLKGVGPKNAERLAKLGIRTIQDLLFHLPARYEDRTRVVPIGSLRPGAHAVIEAEVDLAEVRFGRRRSLLVHVSDGTGAMILRFFHFSKAQQSGFERGVRLRCFGEVRNGPACIEIVHPEYQRVEDGSLPTTEETLTPIYPTTEGLHQLSWRDLSGRALEWLASDSLGLEELLPDSVLQALDVPRLAEALAYVHRPPKGAAVAQLEAGQHPAQQRLALEELLAHQIGLRLLRRQQSARIAPRLQGKGELRQALLGNLEFSLTSAQQRVLRDVEGDLGRDHPMQRLVQGDVGSGKTIVAALALLQAIESGFQGAIMAPTELLAEQHFGNLYAWLAPLGVQVAWLSGRHKGAERQAVLAAIGDGSAQLVVGTHALFQDAVRFQQLGLVVIDEQHRFGVHQRLALRDKGASGAATPHQLIMTATPIPRSLAMTAYADLDLSVIDELPPGRTPIQTLAVSDARRDEVVARVHKACRAGRQAYWVCTLIEESEALQCQAAEDTAAALTEALPELNIALVHGRLKPTQREAVMGAFKSGDVDLLVATTVIEVGVDVPNASLMVIENPERLGLAQLHQLRGRVGRGTAESHCVLLYHPPLSERARDRLAVVRESSDGFHIAQKDLEQRGPGEVLGTRQTGEMQFRIADLLRDQHLVPDVQRLADTMLEQSEPNAQRLIERWIGERVRYAGA